MQPLQRSALRSAQRVRPQVQRQARRQASDSHGGGHGHAAPASESFGRGFYIGLAAIPISLALFKFSQGGDEGSQFTRYITDKYAELGEQFRSTNAVHTQMMEQAAADRVLFLNESNRNSRWVDHRFPELVNHSAPWNVPAGQGSADMSQLIAKYEKENAAQNEEQLKQIAENRVPREQPVEGLTKLTPAAADSA